MEDANPRMMSFCAEPDRPDDPRYLSRQGLIRDVITFGFRSGVCTEMNFDDGILAAMIHAQARQPRKYHVHGEAADLLVAT